MEAFPFFLYIPLACFVGLVALQLTFHQFLRGLSLVKSFFSCLAAASLLFCLLAVLAWMEWRESAWDYLAFLAGDGIIFVCLSYIYINLVNIGNASVRIKVLSLLSNAESWVSKEALLQQYSAKTILQSRLHRLMASAQVRQEQDRLFLGRAKQLWLGKFFRWLRWLVL